MAVPRNVILRKDIIILRIVVYLSSPILNTRFRDIFLISYSRLTHRRNTSKTTSPPIRRPRFLISWRVLGPYLHTRTVEFATTRTGGASSRKYSFGPAAYT